MRVQYICAVNFNGRGFALEFEGPKVVLAGPNESGKSTVIQAMTLGLLGYIPGEGKDGGAMFRRHATDRALPLLVGVTLEPDKDGARLEIRRTWTPGAGLKCHVLVNGNGMSAAAASGAISMLLGKDCGIFDLSAFLELSEPKQIAELLAMSGTKEGDLEAVETQLAAATATTNGLRQQLHGVEATLGEFADVAAADMEPGMTPEQLQSELTALQEKETRLQAEVRESRRLVSARAAQEAIGEDIKRRRRALRSDVVTKKRAGELAAAADKAEAEAATIQVGVDEALAVVSKHREGSSRAVSDKVMTLLCEPCRKKLKDIDKHQREAVKGATAIVERERVKAKEAYESARKTRAASDHAAGERMTYDRQLKRIADDAAKQAEELESLAEPGDVSDVENVLAGITKRKATLDDAYTAARLTARDNGRLVKLKADAASLREDVTAATERAKTLLEKRAALLAVVTDGLREAIDRCLAAHGGWADPVHIEADTRHLSFGIKRDGTFIPHTSFSGGQKTVFYTAFGYAALTMRGSSLRVLAIEAAEADDDNLTGLLATLSEMEVNAFILTCMETDGDDILPGMGSWECHDFRTAPLEGK